MLYNLLPGISLMKYANSRAYIISVIIVVGPLVALMRDQLRTMMDRNTCEV